MHDHNINTELMCVDMISHRYMDWIKIKMIASNSNKRLRMMYQKTDLSFIIIYHSAFLRLLIVF